MKMGKPSWLSHSQFLEDVVKKLLYLVTLSEDFSTLYILTHLKLFNDFEDKPLIKYFDFRLKPANLSNYFLEFDITTRVMFILRIPYVTYEVIYVTHTLEPGRFVLYDKFIKFLIKFYIDEVYKLVNTLAMVKYVISQLSNIDNYMCIGESCNTEVSRKLINFWKFFVKTFKTIYETRQENRYRLFSKYLNVQTIRYNSKTIIFKITDELNLLKKLSTPSTATISGLSLELENSSENEYKLFISSKTHVIEDVLKTIYNKLTVLFSTEDLVNILETLVDTFTVIDKFL